MALRPVCFTDRGSEQIYSRNSASPKDCRPLYAVTSCTISTATISRHPINRQTLLHRQTCISSSTGNSDTTSPFPSFCPTYREPRTHYLYHIIFLPKTKHDSEGDLSPCTPSPFALPMVTFCNTKCHHRFLLSSTKQFFIYNILSTKQFGTTHDTYHSS